MIEEFNVGLQVTEDGSARLVSLQLWDPDKAAANPTQILWLKKELAEALAARLVVAVAEMAPIDLPMPGEPVVPDQTELLMEARWHLNEMCSMVFEFGKGNPEAEEAWAKAVAVLRSIPDAPS